MGKFLQTMFRNDSASTDLRLIAADLGVKQIVRNRDVKDAGTRRVEDGYVVFLNDTRSWRRQRFSFAHELAHIMIDPELDRVERTKVAIENVGKDDLERRCNRLAASLLMPAQKFRTAMKVHGRNPYSISKLSNIFGVSREAAARRLVDLAPRPYAIFECGATRGSGRSQVKWATVSGPLQREGYFVPRGKHVDAVESIRSAFMSTKPEVIVGDDDLSSIGLRRSSHLLAARLFLAWEQPVMVVVDMNDAIHMKMSD